MPVILRLTTPLVGYRVSIVKTDQPLAIRPVKRQRIVQAMRLFRSHRNPSNHEAHPMAAVWIHNEHLPIKVEKHIEDGIACWQ